MSWYLSTAWHTVKDVSAPAATPGPCTCGHNCNLHGDSGGALASLMVPGLKDFQDCLHGFSA